MSTDIKPSPGSKLNRHLQIVNEIKKSVIGLIDSNIDGKDFDQLLTQLIEEVGIDTDAHSMIVGILAQEAESQQTIANRYMHVALTYDACIAGFEAHMKKELSSLGGGHIEGETWKFELEVDEPLISINNEKLNEPYKKSVQVPNESLIRTIVNAGGVLHGVNVTKNFKIKKSVLKKGAQDAHA